MLRIDAMHVYTLGFRIGLQVTRSINEKIADTAPPDPLIVGSFGSWGPLFFGYNHFISLAFEYVSGNTIGIEEPCFRWQLSWGGPQDEFLFPINRHIYTLDGGNSLKFNFTAESVTQYWLRDWGDSSHINLDKENNKIMNSVLRTYGAVGRCFTEFRRGEGIPVHEEPF